MKEVEATEGNLFCTCRHLQAPHLDLASGKTATIAKITDTLLSPDKYHQSKSEGTECHQHKIKGRAQTAGLVGECQKLNRKVVKP